MAQPILIWGAGAVGGTIGAYLARSGADILYVDQDTDHVAALNAGGMVIEGPIEAFTTPARAVTPDQLTGSYDRVVLAVKAQHTESAVRALAPHLGAEGVVVSAQNGLNERVIASVVGPARTLGCFVNFGADYIAPGRILYGGRGAVVVGELDGRRTPRLGEWHALLQRFEAAAEATDDIWGYLWGKLGYGALLFATALTNRSIADALGEPRWALAYRRLGAEVMAVAAASRIKPRGFNGFDPAAFAAGTIDASLAAMVAHNAKSAKTHSGIWRDLAVRKRKTEIDAQIAIIAEIGREVGVATPAIIALVDLIHAVEDGVRALDDATLDALVQQC
jgi:2-dehydropantoate 2-reductase